MKPLLPLLLTPLLLFPQEPDYALTLPGQGGLTFWTHPEEPQPLLPAGETGLGDYVRTLALRRANAPLLQRVRDRYFYRTRSFRDLRTPDALIARLSPTGLAWIQIPPAPILAAGAAFTLPLLLESEMPLSAAPEIRVNGGPPLPASRLARYGAAGYLLPLTAPAAPGPAAARLEIRLAGAVLSLSLPLEIRPPATLRVRLAEPARIYLTAADGLAHTPPGALARLAAAPVDPYFHAAGEFSLTLPAGPALLEAIRGPEYELLRLPLRLAAGANPPVTLTPRRWSHLARDGWHSGDSHVHANYAATTHQDTSPRDVLLLAQAEDLHVLNLAVANSYGDFLHDEPRFTGRPDPASTPEHILSWNEEFRGSDLYGHLGFLGLQTLVRPLFTGLPGSRSPHAYPANYHQARAARDQGAAVTYMHPGYLPGFDGLSAAGGQPKELPVDAALGVIDAIDLLSNAYETASVPLYYRLLNCGLRLGVSAGSDSFLNVRDHYIPGGGRVWVHSGVPLDYARWLAAYKAGRSFVSNGPALRFTVEGRGPGEELPLAAPRSVRLRARVDSRVPVDRVEVIVNGRVVLTRRQLPAVIDQTLPLDGPSWIALRVTGPASRLVVNDAGTFAHTTPVYVTVAGRGVRQSADAAYFVDWIDRLLAQVAAEGRFATPADRDEVLALFTRAKTFYQEIAGRIAF